MAQPSGDTGLQGDHREPPVPPGAQQDGVSAHGGQGPPQDDGDAGREPPFLSEANLRDLGHALEASQTGLHTFYPIQVYHSIFGRDVRPGHSRLNFPVAGVLVPRQQAVYNEDFVQSLMNDLVDLAADTNEEISLLATLAGVQPGPVVNTFSTSDTDSGDLGNGLVQQTSEGGIPLTGAIPTTVAEARSQGIILRPCGHFVSHREPADHRAEPSSKARRRTASKSEPQEAESQEEQEEREEAEEREQGEEPAEREALQDFPPQTLP